MTGERQVLIVSKPYDAILERAPYVEPVIYDGDWQDLEGAYRWAKSKFRRVICTSVYGKDFPMQKRRPSFQLDQWDRAGALAKWDTLPLVLERPKNAEEIVLRNLNDEPTILLGDYSESSPFPRIDELEALLKESFPHHAIKRLSSIRLDNPADLLPIMDACDAFVAIESMPLHLSKASKVPTVALVTDKPSRWHGSAYSQKFLAHIRYSDYDMRKGEIVDAIKRALANKSPIEVMPMSYAPALAYNPSITRAGSKVWTSWRHHPDPKSWRTELALHDGETTLPVIVVGFEQYSLEDARFFTFQGKPHLSLTIARSAKPGEPVSPCVTGYGELVRGEKSWTLKSFIRPSYGKNNFDSQTKNLCFFEHGKKLFCLWQICPEQIVLELEGGAVIRTHNSPCPSYDAAHSFGVPRGGTQPLPFDGKWLRFVHCNQQNPKSDSRLYHLAAVIMEPEPPFTVVGLSKRPILTGTEQFFDHAHYKGNVIIVYGAIEKQFGWTISCGINDSMCGLVDVTREDLNL